MDRAPTPKKRPQEARKRLGRAQVAEKPEAISRPSHEGKVTCPCGYEHPADLGRYGCPNCLGDEVED